MGMGKKKAGQYPFFLRNIFQRVTKPEITVHHFGDLLSVTRSHLGVLAEKILQPAGEGGFALVGVEDSDSIPEKIIKFHGEISYPVGRSLNLI